MNTEKKFSKQLEKLRNDVISTIKKHVERIKNIVDESTDDVYDGIRLTSPIIHKYIDENNNESVASISFNRPLNYLSYNNEIFWCVIDTNLNDYDLPISELKLETLIDVIGQLELFETYEDIENQLM